MHLLVSEGARGQTTDSKILGACRDITGGIGGLTSRVGGGATSVFGDVTSGAVGA